MLVLVIVTYLVRYTLPWTSFIILLYRRTKIAAQTIEDREAALPQPSTSSFYYKNTNAVAVEELKLSSLLTLLQVRSAHLLACTRDVLFTRRRCNPWFLALKLIYFILFSCSQSIMVLVTRFYFPLNFTMIIPTLISLKCISQKRNLSTNQPNPINHHHVSNCTNQERCGTLWRWTSE